MEDSGGTGSRIHPNITQRFAAHIDEQSTKGIYRVERTLDGRSFSFDVYPGVFPPGSPEHSVSSESVYSNLGDVHGKHVLDIGCGCGIESIMAAALGAEHVDAADINDDAVECTKHNATLNGLAGKITAFHSDVFSNVPRGATYDVIIANLPIVNFDPHNVSTPVRHALYDPGLATHRRLLNDAPPYLAKKGCIVFTHANLQSAKTQNLNRDFEELETLIHEHGYDILHKVPREELGYTWINYTIGIAR